MKSLRLFLVSALLIVIGGGAQAEDVQQGSNGVVSIKVHGVREVTKFEDLGEFRRYGKKEQKADIFKNIREGVNSEEYKIILVDVSVKNVDTKKRRVGYDTFKPDSWSHWAGLLYLRGTDGTEYTSAHGLNYDDVFHKTEAGGALTYFLVDGLPMSSEVAPGTEVRGQVAFVVKDWFEPAKLFTTAYDSDNPKFYGVGQIVVPVK